MALAVSSRNFLSLGERQIWEMGPVGQFRVTCSHQAEHYSSYKGCEPPSAVNMKMSGGLQPLTGTAASGVVVVML